jgi:hypothetical protein
MMQCRGLALVLYWYLSVGETGGIADAARNLLGTTCLESLDLI